MFEMIVLNLKALAGDRRGVTAVEYAVIAGVVVLVIVTAFTTLGNNISTTIASVAGKV
jgi:pilus assembly protein Flp/PilA